MKIRVRALFEFINLWYKIYGSYYLDAPGKFLQMIFCLERLTEGGNKNEKMGMPRMRLRL